jgi:hypothetical protein
VGCLTMKEILIDTEKIKEFFYQELVQRGYAPTEKETEELADICFDYLVVLGLIEEGFET